MIRVFQTFLDKRNIPSSFVDEQRTMLHFTMRVCHKSVTHPFLFFHLSSNTKKENFIFIYNKAQTFTSSGFGLSAKKYVSLQKTS